MAPTASSYSRTFSRFGTIRSNLAVHFFLGCLLHIYYESDSDCEYVATLDCDPDTLSTFELTLTLRQDAGRRSWRKKLPELVRLDPV